jgi:hypothetical protein
VPDTQAPTPPAGLSGSFSGGLLHLSWQASNDNVGVDHYELYLNDTPLARIAGAQIQASTHSFEPTGRSVYTVRAFDAAGNQSAVLTSVSVLPVARPKSSPKQIPRSAWQLLRWQLSGQQGARPKTPTSQPSWYAAWKSWRQHPFKLAT